MTLDTFFNRSHSCRTKLVKYDSQDNVFGNGSVSGERMCVGKDLANIMVVFFVATVVQNFKIEGLESGSVDLSYEWSLLTLPKPQELVFVKL